VRDGPRDWDTGLVAVAGASSELTAVFRATAWSLIAGAAAWSRVGAATLVTHLRGEAPNAMFVEQVS